MLTMAEMRPGAAVGQSRPRHRFRASTHLAYAIAMVAEPPRPLLANDGCLDQPSGRPRLPGARTKIPAGPQPPFPPQLKQTHFRPRVIDADRPPAAQRNRGG